MLVLYETPAGYALFKTANDSKLAKVDSIFKYFEDEAKANKFISFQDFSKFKDTSEALEAATALCEGTLSKQLKSFLKKSIVKKKLSDKLAVADASLGNLIKEKLGIPCVCDSAVQQLYRGIRSQLSSLLTGLPDNELRTMTLGLSHSLSRHKIKFSPDKVDTMVIQAIALLDELDKELNTYAMRVREWYGWHFPELVKIVTDTLLYAKIVKKMGMRTNAAQTDLSSIVDEDTENEVKEAAELSMGTEVSEDDILHIEALCDQVISISEYRTTLYDYIKNRMAAIAPNLTVMVGELVGARLIAHAGSLLNLAKAPASTVQILGAEKALFRALKTKHETPKYGLIYHASLVGQSAPKNKGKISRVLAGKTSLAVRVDALGDVDGPTIAFANREKVEARLRSLEGIRASAPSSVHVEHSKYVRSDQAGRGYNQSADVVMKTDESQSKKRKIEEVIEPVAEVVQTDTKKLKREKKESVPKISTSNKEQVEESPKEPQADDQKVAEKKGKKEKKQSVSKKSTSKKEHVEQADDEKVAEKKKKKEKKDKNAKKSVKKSKE